MAPAEARRIALARLGSVNAVREAHRDQRRVALLDNLVRETRHGIRLLWRTPLFTLVAVLSLGLGIGANAAVFTIANALMLRALPVSEPERLALLTGNNWTYPVFDEIRRSEALFGGVAGWAAETRLVHVDGRGEHDALQFVSWRAWRRSSARSCRRSARPKRSPSHRSRSRSRWSSSRVCS